MSIKEDRKDLEKMVSNSREALDDNVIAGAAPPELQMNPTFSLDIHRAKKNCQRRARRMINNATGLMLSDNMVKENPYLKNKMQVDILSIAGLLYQLEINEVMQEALMEEVRSGAAHPRMFEVFGNMSKTIGDLNKQLLQTVEAIKMTYKDIKGDIKDKREELKAIGPAQTGVVRSENGLITFGSKELIEETKRLKMARAIQNSAIEDVQEIKE